MTSFWFTLTACILFPLEHFKLPHPFIVIPWKKIASTYFRISLLVFHRCKQVIQFCNSMRGSKWWQNCHFGCTILLSLTNKQIETNVYFEVLPSSLMYSTHSLEAFLPLSSHFFLFPSLPSPLSNVLMLHSLFARSEHKMHGEERLRGNWL